MTTPNCPKCDGPVWDNRKGKRNPKAPDFKCKDKENCDGAIWLDGKKLPAAASNGATQSAPASDNKDGYWTRKEERDIAKEPIINRMHAQEMALRLLTIQASQGGPVVTAESVFTIADAFVADTLGQATAKPAPAKSDDDLDL